MKSEFWSYVKAERFEEFCHKALPGCVLKGSAKKNYRPAPAQAPYDGLTNGSFAGHRGRIFFEYKGYDTQESPAQTRRDILGDLCGNNRRKGKLVRTAADCPAGKKALFVLVTSAPSTHQFETNIKQHIRKKRLPLKFSCLHRDDVDGWVKQNYSLRRRFSPPGQVRTIAEFLERLRQQGVDVGFPQYAHIDDLYVPPREYKQIERILGKRHIVFIVGPPHVGKTFTAAQLLWRYYREFGRGPEWVVPKTGPRGEPFPDDPRRAGAEPEDPADLIAARIGPDKATYVEDIFGRTSEEEARWKDVRPEEILRLVIKRAQGAGTDARVIVTSREKLFEKALKRSPNLASLVVRLRKRPVRLGLASYTKANKLDLLKGYAGLYECPWRRELPRDVRSAAAKLETPHAIRWFCELARSATTPKQRETCLKKARQELRRGYANEICDLDEKPLAVLLIAAVFGRWRYLAGSSKFSELFSAAVPRLAQPSADAACNEAAAALEGRLRLVRFGGATFEHPDYKAAVILALRAKRVKALFREMTTNLARDTRATMRAAAASACAGNLKALGAPGRALLSKLAADRLPDVRAQTAKALGLNFPDLDAEARALLAKLARDRLQKVRAATPFGLTWNFEHLDADGRGLLSELVVDRSQDVRASAASWLGRDFEKLDARGRALLGRLAADRSQEVRGSTADALGWRYEKLDAEGRALLGRLKRDRAASVRRAAKSRPRRRKK